MKKGSKKFKAMQENGKSLDTIWVDELKNSDFVAKMIEHNEKRINYGKPIWMSIIDELPNFHIDLIRNCFTNNYYNQIMQSPVQWSNLTELLEHKIAEFEKYMIVPASKVLLNKKTSNDLAQEFRYKPDINIRLVNLKQEIDNTLPNGEIIASSDNRLKKLNRKSFL